MESKDEVSDSDSGIILQSGECCPGPGVAGLRCLRSRGRGRRCSRKGLCWEQTWESSRAPFPGVLILSGTSAFNFVPSDH